MKTVLLLFVLVQVRGAPKSKSSNLPQTLYDQKQKGEYNIQVHLKDFQIIALLGDDALGDYDYDYDYSDLTVKPPAGNITLKPTTEASSTPPSSSSKPENQSLSETSSENSGNITTTSAPGNITEKDTESSSSTTNSPDRIKVQIIQDAPHSVPIVPGEELTSANRAPSLGEILQYKRCAAGYSRDKKGRCRRVRRPHVPFNLGRLASNLAARLKPSAESSAESQ